MYVSSSRDMYIKQETVECRYNRNNDDILVLSHLFDALCQKHFKARRTGEFYLP